MTCTWPMQKWTMPGHVLRNTRDVMIPQRIETVASAQQEVNYMLIGVFELLALKQDEYDTYQGYLEAIRDYWLARADLGLATGTALPSSAQIGEQRIDVEQFTQPASGGMDHSAHGAMSGGAPMKDMGSTDSAPMDHSAHGATITEQQRWTWKVWTQCPWITRAT